VVAETDRAKRKLCARGGKRVRERRERRGRRRKGDRGGGER
jgi:hypothetical protein